jgi:hypothetical protein
MPARSVKVAMGILPLACDVLMDHVNQQGGGKGIAEGKKR